MYGEDERQGREKLRINILLTQCATVNFQMWLFTITQILLLATLLEEQNDS